MNSFNRLAPYALIAILLALVGCPYGPWRHDDHGGNHGSVDQQQSQRGRPEDGRRDGGNRGPGSDRDRHEDSGRDHQ